MLFAFRALLWALKLLFQNVITVLERTQKVMVGCEVHCNRYYEKWRVFVCFCVRVLCIIEEFLNKDKFSKQYIVLLDCAPQYCYRWICRRGLFYMLVRLTDCISIAMNPEQQIRDVNEMLHTFNKHVHSAKIIKRGNLFQGVTLSISATQLKVICLLNKVINSKDNIWICARKFRWS